MISESVMVGRWEELAQQLGVSRQSVSLKWESMAPCLIFKKIWL